ncbi:MAG: hypothetical protein A4E49_00365 [Methanosaeta sp. PtaU1.Bin112]|nr:MAG: hypothetical protein A4E49_00365 [Methanosaeta sp. PtaU1.Bin112]
MPKLGPYYFLSVWVYCYNPNWHSSYLVVLFYLVQYIGFFGRYTDPDSGLSTNIHYVQVKVVMQIKVKTHG